jgi:predicted Zn-ribbon and HTH transcriptional regulator
MILTCKRRGYQWQPRVKKPKECPVCKNRKWDKE